LLVFPLPLGRSILTEIEQRLSFIGLDAATRAVLPDIASMISAALPSILDGFYAHIRKDPRIAALFPNEAVVEHAKKAQLRHWLTIAEGKFDAAFLQSATKIGETHFRIGLEPRYYIAGYSWILTGLLGEVEKRMAGWRKSRARKLALQDAITRAAMFDMDVALDVYNRENTESKQRKVLLEMCEMLEADLDSAVGEVLSMSNDAAIRGAGAAADARSIAAEAGTLATSSDQASASVTSVSGAAEELSVTGREIAARAAESAKCASRAAEEAARAGATVAALNEAAEGIGSVISTIAEVASQTNLLALNATIEAARAGEMGRGFAVVAHEVKALARKTSEAAEDIGRRVQNICAATADSVAVIKQIGGAVSEINGISAAVAAAAEEQEATLREVSRSLQETSASVAIVAGNVTRISARSVEIEQSSNLVSELVNGTNGRVAELRANLVVSLRQSSAGDRRSTEYRRPAMIPARMSSGAATIEGMILDLSEGGLRFRAGSPNFVAVEGEPARVTAQAFGTVGGTIIAVGKTSIHVQFHNLDAERQAAVAGYLRGVDAADQKLVDAARAAAGKIGAVFEAEIEQGRISQEQLFDFRHRPIANTDPEQFETAFTALCDRMLPQIQEPILKLDQRIVFCAAVDQKSYLPTHNTQFSLPQKPNDPVWNAAHSRNRRFYKDRAGMTAARTTREFVMQTYDRNMGGGVIVTLKEIDVPIRVKGRHWGGLRLAFKAT
jgi:methyl-accepting chemotaxis protein